MPQIKSHLKDVYRMDLSKSRKGFLRLDMNECIPGLPEEFVQNVLSKIDADYLSSYPEYHVLEKKIAAHNNLHPSNIVLANGSDGAIKYIFDTYIQPGDKVLLTDPTFAMYPVYSKIFNSTCVTVCYNDDLTFPEREFIDKISPDIRMAVITNPNNPTGQALDKDKLVEIIDKAAHYNVLTVIDEAYYYFYPQTVIDLINRYDNLIVLRTFSKVCGLAGLRLGYAAACPEIIDGIRKVRPSFDVNAIVLMFGLEILDRPDIIQTVIDQTNEGKEYLTRELAKHGIHYINSTANFLLIRCLTESGEIAQKLAEKKILVGANFKQPFLRDYIRVTLGSRDIMEVFLKEFLKITKEL